MCASKMQSKAWYEKMYLKKGNALGWNIGKTHPGLVELLDAELLPPGRVIVPGCGLGYDAIALAEKGFSVVAFDFSTNAMRKAKVKVRSRRNLKARLQFVVEDIYKLPDWYKGAFDYVVEIGNFQAMSVKERRGYVNIMSEVLVRAGKCIVICKKYPPLTPGPKGVKKASLSNYFSTHFVVESVEPVLMYRTIPPLDGLRLMGRKRR